MANRFNFKLLTGADPQAQYAGINPHDAYTFYLLNDGTGYLGDTPLFGGDAEKFNIITSAGAATLEANKVYVFTVDGVVVGTTTYPAGIYSTDASGTPDNITYKTIAQYITDKAIKAADITNASSFAGSGDDTTIMSTDAIVKYVSGMLTASSMLDIAFFKSVELVTLTQAMITNEEITLKSGDVATAAKGLDFTGAHKGDKVLVFVTEIGQDETPDTDDTYTMVNLHDMIATYEFDSSDSSVTVTETPDATNPHNTKVDFKVNAADSLVAANISADADNLAEGKPTTSIASLAENKFVTEKQFAEILANVLKDYVKYSEN